MQTAIVQIIIALFSFSLFSVALKYIFSPHYRLQLSKEKFKEKHDSLEKLNGIYKEHLKSTEKLSPFVLEARVNSCLGTDQYDHRLIFLLIQGQFANLERSAKRVNDAWPFLDIKYPDGKIKLINRLQLKTVKFWRMVALWTYIALSAFLIFLIISFNYNWFGNWLFIVSFATLMLMFISVSMGSKLSTILSIERLLEP